MTTRPLSFASDALTLEGVLHLPPEGEGVPGVVVCHPHTQYGGDMENNVVLAACQALADRGCAALRFNFRGAGGSDGAFDQGTGEREDARAALRELSAQPEVDSSRLGLIGYSFGAMVAAEVAGAALRALALVSPLLSFADLRVGWGCPTLVLGGDEDSLAPVDRLHVLGGTPDVELHVAVGADHSWWGFEDELSEVLGGFFARHFA